jgi:hypothetical protein
MPVYRKVKMGISSFRKYAANYTLFTPIYLLFSPKKITLRSTPEPHCGIISGWRALRSAHGDTDPVPVRAEI